MWTRDKLSKSLQKRWLTPALGPLVTLGTAVAIEFFSETAFRIPNPNAILILTVVFSALTTGLYAGLVSAAIAFLYTAYDFSIPDQPFHYTTADSIRLAIWAITTPATAFVVGILKRRNERMGEITHANATLQAQNTERKAVEIELRESQGRLAAIIDSAMDAVITMDADHRIVLFNPAAEKMFRCRTEEARGQPIDRFIPERFRTTHRELVRHFGETGVTRRGIGILQPLNALRADGEEFPMEESISQVQVGGQKLFTVILRDITERKRAEEEIKRRADEFKALYDTSRDLAMYVDVSALLNTIVDRAKNLLSAESGFIYLYDPANGELELTIAQGFPVAIGTRLGIGEGMAGRVAQTRQSLIVDDYQTWKDRSLKFEAGSYRAIVEVPMLVGGELIGVLGVNEFGESTRRFTAADADLLSLFAGQAASAVHNARLLEETKRRASEFAALFHTARDLMAQSELHLLLETIVERAMHLLTTASGFLYLYHETRDELELAVTKGTDSPRSPILHVGKGIAGRVAQSNQPLMVNDYQTWEHRSAKYTAVGYRAILEVPMTFGGKLIGVLGVNEIGESTRQFTENDSRMLSLFAAQAASAVHNARLFEETERHLLRVQALHQIDRAIGSSLDLRVTLSTFLTHATVQLEVDAADVLSLNPQTQTLEYIAGLGFRTRALQHTHLRLGDGLAGRAALERKTIAIPDLARDIDGLLRSPLIQNESFVSYYGVPLIAKGRVNGVLEIFHRSALDADQEWLGFLETLAGQAAIAIDNAQLFGNLQHANIELALAYDTTLEGWSRALDLRDKETEGHTQRVTQVTLRLAREMGISESNLVHIRRGALLHDIGKMGVPDAILFKPGPLTDDEWRVMRKHPTFAYELLAPISFLSPALDIPYCHHEKWDGTGYPRGLKAEQIPLAARLFAVVDVHDALTSDRPYRSKWSPERALAYIRSESGKHFDPRMVEFFLRMVETSV